MGVHVRMCKCVLDFLLDRSQVVKVNSMFSNPLTINTGAPQGCFFSPLVLTLFTNDCVSSHDSVLIFMFSDDTTIEVLIRKSDESTYREEFERMVDCCDENNLELSASKTKENYNDH